MVFTKRMQVGPPRTPKVKRAESADSRRRRAEWQRERDEHLAKHPNCQHPKLGGLECSGRREAHHVRPRGMGGTRGKHGPLVTLCRIHHDWVELNRIEARALGLLLRRFVEGRA